MVALVHHCRGCCCWVLVGALVGFNAFRDHAIKQFFASNKPPPTPVAVAEAKSEVVPNLLTAVGDLAAVHQVNVTTDVGGRVTDIMFAAGSSVKQGGAAGCNCLTRRNRAISLVSRRRPFVSQLSLDRAKQLAAHQFGPQSTVDQAQAAFDQAKAGIAKTEAIISQKLVRGAVRRRTRRAPCRGRPVPHRRHHDRDANGPVDALCQFHGDRKAEVAQLKSGQTVRLAVDAYPGRPFEGKITAIEPQISADTRNIHVQATIDNPSIS